MTKDNIKPTLAVMAAGLGQRYGGLKQLDPVHGNTLFEYGMYDALAAGFGKIVILIRKDFEKDFMERFGKSIEKAAKKFNADIDFAYQESVVEIGEELPFREKMWGTGHAALCFRKTIREPFALINADDFYGRKSFKILYDFFNDKNYDPAGNTHAMVGFFLKNVVSPHGHVSRGVCEVSSDGFLGFITEKEKIIVEENRIFSIENEAKYPFDDNSITSMNFWGLNPAFFDELDAGFKEFHKSIVERKEPREEFYVSDFIGKLLKKNKLKVKVLPTTEHWIGLTYKGDHPLAADAIKELIQNGVYPENLWD